MAHTPTPWHCDATLDMQVDDLRFRPVFAPDGCEACRVIVGTELGSNGGQRRTTPEEDAIEGEANAEFIVRAVNNHERLVGALAILIQDIEQFQRSEGVSFAGYQSALKLAKERLRDADDESDTAITALAAAREEVTE